MSGVTPARTGHALLASALAALVSAAIVYGMFLHFDDWMPALIVYGIFWVTVVALFHPRTDPGAA